MSHYPGNKETDVSQRLAYDQSNPQVIEKDVVLAADSGLTGFAVNWIGTGTTQQSASASDYDRRLAAVFTAVHKVNAAGKPFHLILNYQSSAKTLSVNQFVNDMGYFASTYGSDPALDHSWSPKPEVIMAGTWKYNDGDLAAISEQLRPKLYLLGDEKPASWNAARAAQLDGTSYYWSSQNPYSNASSFMTLTRFAARVRATHNPDGSAKTWLAPFTPGYNASLRYGTTTCVPRNNGETLRRLWQGNKASAPDGWTLISWNEITEGSYVVPLTRYGNQYTEALKTVLASSK